MNDLEILKKRVLDLIDKYGSIRTRNVSEENFKDARLIGYKDVVHIIDTMLKSKFKPGDQIRDKSSSDQKIYTVTEFITEGIAFVDEYGERFTKYFDEDDWDVYELVKDSDKQQDRLKEAKDNLKWRKKHAELLCHERTNSKDFAYMGNDTCKPCICMDGYYISLAALEYLPKDDEV